MYNALKLAHMQWLVCTCNDTHSLSMLSQLERDDETHRTTIQHTTDIAKPPQTPQTWACSFGTWFTVVDPTVTCVLVTPKTLCPFDHAEESSTNSIPRPLPHSLHHWEQHRHLQQYKRKLQKPHKPKSHSSYSMANRSIFFISFVTRQLTRPDPSWCELIRIHAGWKKEARANGKMKKMKLKKKQHYHIRTLGYWMYIISYGYIHHGVTRTRALCERW